MYLDKSFYDLKEAHKNSIIGIAKKKVLEQTPKIQKYPRISTTSKNIY